ncbi:IS66 family transposase zinc-finger binding domain-containing protein, partial [Psychrobium sp. 1_MG-2023]|uniref:IS66 family transposase zinc-finger binding domain-containing protein n=1 Tax=Psychrobium sp. 1_MG-2023 TaxID=3062624 RepID=UPI0027328E98
MTKDLSVEQLHQQLAALQAQVESLQNDKAQMQQKIDLLISKLNLSNAQRFGKKSEKAPRGIFNEAEQIKAEPKHHKKGKQTLPEHLEREESVYELDDTRCTCCGSDMHVCGSEDSEQIKIIPEKISVIRHKQLKYACRECEHTQIKNKVVTASKSKQPIPRSMASPHTLAAVVTA